MASPVFSLRPQDTRVSHSFYGGDFGFSPSSFRGALAVKPLTTPVIESPRREPPSLQGLTDIVEVLIGPDDVGWKLHRDLLIADSATAKAMLTGRFQESLSQRAIFSELEVDGFAIYATYLYSHTLSPSATTSLDRLLKAYVVGDYLVSPDFQDLVFRAIFNKVAEASPPLSPRQVDYIMGNTSYKSALRRFTADVVGAAILKKQYRFADEHAFTPSPHAFPQVLSADYKADMLDGVLNALKLQDFKGQNVTFSNTFYLPHSAVGGGAAVATVEASGRKDEHVGFSFGTWRV